MGEVARALGVSAGTVYGLCNRGELAHVRLLHNAIRIEPAALAAFIECHRSKKP